MLAHLSTNANRPKEPTLLVETLESVATLRCKIEEKLRLENEKERELCQMQERKKQSQMEELLPSFKTFENHCFEGAKENQTSQTKQMSLGFEMGSASNKIDVVKEEKERD